MSGIGARACRELAKVLFVVPGVACLGACGGVDCGKLLGLTRGELWQCLDFGRPWTESGAHEGGGRVRSVGWVDHDEDTEQNVVNWIPDDTWLRDVVVFEHASSDPLQTSADDEIVGYLRLGCEWDRSILHGNSLITTELEQEGDVPSVLVGCGEWPASIEAEPGVPVAGDCYADLLCPLGTLCHEVEAAALCPEAGWICASSPPEPAAVDQDGDGQGNCSDDDIDGDGLSNDEERAGGRTGFASDPWNADTDGDGRTDDRDPYPTMACEGGVLMADTFVEDPASRWSGVGAWSWDGETYTATAELRDHHVAWVGPQEWTDLAVQTRLRFPHENGTAGLIVRAESIDGYENGGHHYYAALDPYQDLAVLGYSDGMTFTELGRAGLEVQPGVWYVLEVAVSGNEIEVYVDRQRVLEASDATYARGSVGLRVHEVYAEASFDYILACE
jgi:hypothetical protein